MSDPIEEKDQTAAAESAEELESPEPEVEAAAESVDAEVVDEAEAEAIDTEQAEEAEELVAEADDDAMEADDAEDAEEEAVAPAASARSAREPRKAREQRPAPKPSAPKQYAVIKTGGKQYRVSVGDTISVERLTAEAGSEISFDEVLLIGGDGSTKIGTPIVSGASVSAQVDDHFRGEKIVVFKYKPKKRYRRRTGHRQELTHLTITGISN